MGLAASLREAEVRIALKVGLREGHLTQRALTEQVIDLFSRNASMGEVYSKLTGKEDLQGRYELIELGTQSNNDFRRGTVARNGEPVYIRYANGFNFGEHVIARIKSGKHYLCDEGIVTCNYIASGIPPYFNSETGHNGSEVFLLGYWSQRMKKVCDERYGSEYPRKVTQIYPFYDPGQMGLIPFVTDETSKEGPFEKRRLIVFRMGGIVNDDYIHDLKQVFWRFPGEEHHSNVILHDELVSMDELYKFLRTAGKIPMGLVTMQ